MNLKRMNLALLAAVAAMSFSGMAPASAQTVLRFGHDQPIEYGYTKAGEILDRAVREATGDDVTVRIFPGGQLGSEPSMIEGVMAGNIDFSVSAAPNVSTIVPEIGFFSIGYLFDDLEHVMRTLHDEEFQGMIDELIDSKNLGLKRAGFFVSGLRNVYAAKAVETPEDMAGMKFRVMASPIESQIWGALGTSPINLPTSDIYTGLQTGLVQGGETTPGAYVMNKYNEVGPFYSLTEHQWSVSFIFMSDATVAKLSPEALAAIDAAEAEIIDATSDAVMTTDLALIEELEEKYGVTVTEVDKSQFQARVASAQDEIAASLGVTPIIERIRALRNQ